MPGDKIGTCVQSILPITRGTLAFLKKSVCALVMSSFLGICMYCGANNAIALLTRFIILLAELLLTLQKLPHAVTNLHVA